MGRESDDQPEEDDELLGEVFLDEEDQAELQAAMRRHPSAARKVIEFTERDPEPPLA